jgi:hypothetical protein
VVLQIRFHFTHLSQQSQALARIPSNYTSDDTGRIVSYHR